jgi:hypothetical protein
MPEIAGNGRARVLDPIERVSEVIFGLLMAMTFILAGQLPDTNVAVLAFGLVALALLLAGEKLAPGRPVALAVVVLSIVALSVTPLGSLGFSIVGELPRGLPDFQSPELRLRDVDGAIPLAFACLLLAYVEGVSAARTLAQKDGCAIVGRRRFPPGRGARRRDMLRAEGLEERAGYFGRRIAAVDVVDEFEGFPQPAGSSAGKPVS